MLSNVLSIGAGLVGLVAGGNLLIKGAARLASAVGISTLIIGLTVVALGTSAPELIVSLSAAFTASSDVAIGNVVGSNIANIGLIMAISALISPIVIHWRLLRREIVVLIGGSILTFGLTSDGEIGRLDGLILVVGFVAYTVLLIRQGQRDRREIAPELQQYEREENLVDKQAKPVIEIGRVVIGLALLLLGANFLVGGATAVAREVGVSDLVIGLTLVAVGTSLPELVTCIIAARRKEHDIVFGNVVGSNISNLLIILGIVALVQPIPISEKILTVDLPVMILFALTILPLAVRGGISRMFAVGLMILYGGYIILSFVG